MNQLPEPTPDLDDEINEADDLRREEHEARTREYFEALDRKDRAGPHYLYR